MRWINLFMDTLNEWDENTPSKYQSLNDVSSYLCVTIGGKFNFDGKTGMSDLKERMVYLVENESIQEQFLVDGLVQFTTDYLRSFIEKRGEHITNEERVIDAYKREGTEVPKNSYERLERLKSDEDNINSIITLSNWEVVVANNFSLLNRRRLFNEEMNEQFDKHTNFYDSLPEEDRNKTFGELREKYKK